MTNMARERLIDAYESMMFRYGEYDIWEDDIQPKLHSMSFQEIHNQYLMDKKYYSERAAVGGCW